MTSLEPQRRVPHYMVFRLHGMTATLQDAMRYLRNAGGGKVDSLLWADSGQIRLTAVLLSGRRQSTESQEHPCILVKNKTKQNIQTTKLDFGNGPHPPIS